MIFFNTNKGGFLPIESSSFFNKIFLLNTQLEHLKNIESNILNHKIQNIININDTNDTNDIESRENYLIFTEEITEKLTENLFSILKSVENKILISKFNNKLINSYFKYIYQISGTEFYVYLNDNCNSVKKDHVKETGGHHLLLRL